MKRSGSCDDLLKSSFNKSFMRISTNLVTKKEQMKEK
jgi:hypothetical protein